MATMAEMAVTTYPGHLLFRNGVHAAHNLASIGIPQRDIDILLDGARNERSSQRIVQLPKALGLVSITAAREEAGFYVALETPSYQQDMTEGDVRQVSSLSPNSTLMNAVMANDPSATRSINFKIATITPADLEDAIRALDVTFNVVKLRGAIALGAYMLAQIVNDEETARVVRFELGPEPDTRQIADHLLSPRMVLIRTREGRAKRVPEYASGMAFIVGPGTMAAALGSAPPEPGEPRRFNLSITSTTNPMYGMARPMLPEQIAHADSLLEQIRQGI